MRKRKSANRSTHFLVPGVWYLMINFPLVVFVKSGITKKDPNHRAKQVDRSAPGIPIPIFFVITFGHKELEQWSHRAFKSLSVSYYKGDGQTEWFWLPAAVPIILVMSGIWIGYLWFFAAMITGDFEAATDVMLQVFTVAKNALK